MKKLTQKRYERAIKSCMGWRSIRKDHFVLPK